MDRGRRFTATPPAPGEPDAAAKRDCAGRSWTTCVGRSSGRWGSRPAAEELAKAAQAVLRAAEAERIDLDSMSLNALRAALAEYREVRGS